jgi:hypothetical protein
MFMRPAAGIVTVRKLRGRLHRLLTFGTGRPRPGSADADLPITAVPHDPDRWATLVEIARLLEHRSEAELWLVLGVCLTGLEAKGLDEALIIDVIKEGQLRANELSRHVKRIAE